MANKRKKKRIKKQENKKHSYLNKSNRRINYDQQFTKTQKIAFVRPAFEYLGLDFDDPKEVVHNKLYSSFYFIYNNKRIRISLHHQSLSFKESHPPNYEIEIVACTYEKLVKVICGLKRKTNYNLGTMWYN